jgi:cytochrome subunit of sulfide dehydrogenase
MRTYWDLREVYMRELSLAAIAVAGFAISAAAVAADAKLVQNCNDCHGDNGLSQSQDVPTIAGVSATVLEGALTAFKAKELPCTKLSYKHGDTKRPQTDMCAVAGALSDAQKKDLAAHYSKLPFKPMQQPVDAVKVAAGKKLHARDCESCHSKGGRDPADDAGLLGGQPLGYLKAALDQFKAGKREMDKKMKDKISKLSSADLDALAHYYASAQ